MQCEAVENRIDHCKYYDDNITCVVCETGYYLNSHSKCEEGSAKNC